MGNRNNPFDETDQPDRLEIGDKAVSHYATTLVKTVREPVLLLDADYRIEAASRAFYQQFLLSPKAVEGKLIYHLDNGAWDTAPLRQLLTEELTEKRTVEAYELLLDLPGYGPRLLVVNARCLEPSELILLAIEDVTGPPIRDLVQIERQRLEAIMTQLPVGIILAGPDGELLYANPTSDLIFQHPLIPSRNTDDYKDWNLYLPDTDEPYPVEQLPLARTVLNGEVISGEEIRTRWPDGSWRHLSVNTAPLYNAKGQLLLGIAAFVDITKQKQAEAALRESEARFRTLADNIAQLAWMTDETGWIFWYNRRWFEYTGTTLAEMEGWGWKTVHHPDHVERVVEKVSHSFATGTVWEDTFPLRGKDGNYRWFLSRAIPIRDDDGQVLGWFGTNTDVTEQREVEQALRELSENLEQRVMARTQALRDSEERFRALVEASAQIVWTTDAVGAIIEDSPSWRAYTGQSYEAWRGWGWLEMIHPDDRIDVAQLWRKAVAATTPINTDYRLYHHSGQWRWSNVRAVPLRSLSGTVRGWVGMIIDIDAHKQAEVALHRLNEALEARTKEIHTLASRLTMAEQEERRRISQILHDDLQQHLYGIQMKIDYARYGAEAGDQAQMMKNIAEAEAWLVQATNITRHLTVDLSPPVLKNEGLTDTLSWLVTQMQSLYDLTVVVTATQSFRMASEDMRVLFFQIIRELLFNVVKHAETNRATVKLQLVEKELMIEVADEGIGFDVSRAAAQVDDHSRFGLFSARERLRLFGGQLEIDSAPGQGTRINIAVPVDLI